MTSRSSWDTGGDGDWLSCGENKTQLPEPAAVQTCTRSEGLSGIGRPYPGSADGLLAPQGPSEPISPTLTAGLPQTPLKGSSSALLFWEHQALAINVCWLLKGKTLE